MRANVRRDAVKRLVPPYHACHCSIMDRMRAVIFESHSQVVPFYELEKSGAFGDDNPAGVAFAAARLAAGAAAARDMIVDAWRASVTMGVGFPMVSVADIESGRHILVRDDFSND